MSSDTFWSNACKDARGKPLQELLGALYYSCGTTVSLISPNVLLSIV